MKNLLLLFIILLCALGCTPELVAHQEEEKKTEIKDSILDFEPGSRDSVWLEEEKQKAAYWAALMDIKNPIRIKL